MRYFILMFALILTGCSTSTATSADKLGYWVDGKPYRGTLEKNRNNVHPYWQCVEGFIPYKNKQC